jgi:polar amino acid transport system substrate-binding protein
MNKYMRIIFALTAFIAVVLLVSCASPAEDADTPEPTEVTQDATDTPVPTSPSEAGEQPDLSGAAPLTEGQIHFAADFGAPPNQFINDDGERDGLNPAICNEIANKIGLEPNWTNLAFPGLIPGLQANRFDALCTSVFINPERQEIMNMVPYVQWGEGVLVKPGNPEEITCDYTKGNDESYDPCYEAMQGLTVAVPAGGTQEAHFGEYNEQFENQGEPTINLRGFDSSADVFQALVAGQADAAAVNDPQGQFFINRNPGEAEFAFEGYSLQPLALTTLKDNVELADALKWALEEMEAESSYNRILDEWGLTSVESFEFQR